MRMNECTKCPKCADDFLSACRADHSVNWASRNVSSCFVHAALRLLAVIPGSRLPLGFWHSHRATWQPTARQFGSLQHSYAE